MVKWQFPYYIVRFKQHPKFNDECIYLSFPYYIVRFKLGEKEIYLLKDVSFHTT